MAKKYTKEFKEKIKAAMIEHLKASVNYPQCTDEQIMQQLKPMWVMLEEKQLILPGLTFQGFVDQANNQFLLAQVKDILNI